MERKPKLTVHQRREALERKAAGEPVTEIARSYNAALPAGLPTGHTQTR